MTAQASIAVVFDAFPLTGQLVGIVTGDAAHLAVAFLVTATNYHLLKMADHFNAACGTLVGPGGS